MMPMCRIRMLATTHEVRPKITRYQAWPLMPKGPAVGGMLRYYPKNEQDHVRDHIPRPSFRRLVYPFATVTQKDERAISRGLIRAPTRRPPPPMERPRGMGNISAFEGFPLFQLRDCLPVLKAVL